MKKLLAVGALVFVVAASAGPIASAARGESAGSAYSGTEYDLGGTAKAIDGALPAVEQLANDITRVTDQAAADVARRRATLPYGRVEGAAGPAQLVTYGAPDEAFASGRYAISDQYAVTLSQGGRTVDSLVAKAEARRTGSAFNDPNKEEDTSWTSFSFAGTATVSVRKLAGTATGCLVRPSSAHIATTFSEGVCTFTLTHPANVSVEFVPNTTNPVLHPMLVFANPPEAVVPPQGDPNVLYFGPGMHAGLGRINLRSNETVYIAGGAWVQAHFVGRNLENVVIRGRGVLDGSFLDNGNEADNHAQPGLIDILGSSNVVVEGVTLVDGTRFNVRALGDHDTIHNVKAISWWYSSDGVVAGNPSVIEDSFIKVNDDSIKLFWGNTVARHNVVWQLVNGAPFMFSWNIHVDSHDFHVYDNDVIHAEHDQLSPQAVFRARHASEGHLSRYLFEDIRVEDASWRLFYVILEKHPKWYDPALGFGQISDVVFRNVTATTPFTHPSVFAGQTADHLVNDVNLVDVFMDGACVTTAADGNFEIAPDSTDEIRLLRTIGTGCGG